MAHSCELKIADQISLVDPHFGGGIASISLWPGRAIAACWHNTGVDMGCRNNSIAINTAIACEILQAQVVVEVVFKVGGEDALFNPLLVEVPSTEVGTWANPW